MKEIRKASCNELLYMDLQDLTCAYTIQFVFRIHSLRDKAKLEEAINYVIAHTKGCNIYLRHKSFYLNEEPVHVQEVQADHDDLYNSSVFREGIDYQKEALKVFIVHHKSGEYLYFRILHSVMDGKGALMFVENVVRYLQGKELTECSNRITDRDFIKDLKWNRDKVKKFPNITHPKTQNFKGYKQKWRVIEFDGYVPAIVAKIACFFTKEFTNDTVKFMIPTDIRRHNRSENFMGNLTLPIFLDVKKGETYQAVNGRLLYSLKNSSELNKTHTSYFGYAGYPKGVRKFALKNGLKAVAKYKKFSIGALISFLGRIDLEQYKNPCFEPLDFISLPVHQPLGTCSMVIAEYNQKTRIAISYFEGQFDEEYMDTLTAELKDFLSDPIYEMNQTDKTLEKPYWKRLEDAFTNYASETAVKEENASYTYEELKEGILKYTDFLREQGMERQDKIVLHLERGFEFLAAVLACVANGVIYIPTDKTIPTERLKMVAALSNCKVVLSDTEGIHIDDIPIVCPKEIPNEGVKDAFRFDCREEDIVYQIYTSGTTGTPKCVPISNRNLNNFMNWITDITLSKTQSKVVMPLFTSLSVDLTVTSVFLPFLCGGIVKTYKEFFSKTLLKKIMQDEEINVIKGTPTHFSFVNDETCKGKELFIIGGEKLSANLCEKIAKAAGEQCAVMNEYGPTETTVGCTYCFYDSKYKNTVPIGRPIYNTRVCIYDNGVVKESNHVGELLVSGESVFGGYPGLDMDCFVTIQGRTYYRTGDAVYYNAGNLHYTERLDNQVKIKGNRVEPDEVKHLIDSMEEVCDSVVVYEKELYAYVIPAGEIAEEEIREYLHKQLPNYMIPREIHLVKEFPILPGGKIDKKELLKKNTESVLAEEAAEYPDDFMKVITRVRSEIVPDPNRTLFALGMESFDVINMLQLLVEQYIPANKEEEFVNRVITNYDNITLGELERIVKEYSHT